MVHHIYLLRCSNMHIYRDFLWIYEPGEGAYNMRVGLRKDKGAMDNLCIKAREFFKCYHTWSSISTHLGAPAHTFMGISFGCINQERGATGRTEGLRKGHWTFLCVIGKEIHQKLSHLAHHNSPLGCTSTPVSGDFLWIYEPGEGV